MIRTLFTGFGDRALSQENAPVCARLKEPDAV